MPRIDDTSKQQRAERIWLKVRSNPNGIREARIAQELSLGRKTVNNYLRDLEFEGKIIKQGVLWFPAPWQKTRLSPFELTPEEAIALYLGVRLLAKQHDKRNEPAETALIKLAQVLKSDAGVGDEIEQAARELAQRPVKENYSPIFRDIVRGYIYRKKVKIEYKPLGQKKGFETIFSTYLLEPSAVGFSTYLIGHSSIVDELRSYKLERVQNVQLTNEDYKIPDDFDGLAILRNAWNIISGENTVEVVLRFSPQVQERVLETQWHPSQQTKDDPEKDGWLRWSAQVGGTMDMLPWIRGWGADVEVLEPDSLKEKLKNTALSLGKIYEAMDEANRPRLYLPYAKTNPDDRERIHLLLYHLIDVGQVAIEMWANVLTEGIRLDLAEMLNLSVEDSGRFFAFLAALHDIGKAGPAYQNKYAPNWLKTDLEEAGLKLGKPADGKAWDSKKTPHGHITTWVLENLLPETLKLNQRFSQKIAAALGGHHGSWPPPNATEHIRDNEAWDSLRKDLIWHLRATFYPPMEVISPSNTTDLNTFLTILSGLTSVADWIGSRNTERFEFIEEVIPTRQYAKLAKEKAQAELKGLGWIGWQPKGETKTFEETFAYLNFTKARDTQQAVIDIAQNINKPTLLILEAPTGSGKTETALYLADSWLQQNKGRGLYIAMPTQATSNQMFKRTKKHLEQRYPHDFVNLHLAHGQAGWSDAMKEIKLQSIGDNAEDGVVAMSWFTPRKRTLLAPFGVGTVDQTLMSILQTKHFFVRLFGLAHKVVIFDEVHAYDTYMNTLFHRLLEWLRAIGTSVIILSATLPTKTRRDLVYHYTGKNLDEGESAYPALTIANADRQETLPLLRKPDDYSLSLDWNLDRDPASLVEFLRGELSNGGCAAIICNTVRRAQDIYRALSEANLVSEDDLILFHSRFPPIWRKDIEDKVLKKFGKPDEDGTSHRPHKAIVVATQVIEQSLDIDFDLMITDLAPIDLILQRAGRLHRHKNNERYGLPRRLMITKPEKDEEGLPDFGIDELIYARYILLRSYFALKNQSQKIIMPTDTVELIEKVYGDIKLLDGVNDTQLEKTKSTEQSMRRNEKKAQAKAKQQLVRAPHTEGLLARRYQALDEDNPTLHATMQASTRDIPPNVSIVCLFQSKDGVFLNPECVGAKINLEKSPSFKKSKEIAQNIIMVTRWKIVEYLRDKKVKQWAENSILRHHQLLIFQNNNCSIPEINSTLRLTRKYGLEIFDEKEN